MRKRDTKRWKRTLLLCWQSIRIRLSWKLCSIKKQWLTALETFAFQRDEKKACEFSSFVEACDDRDNYLEMMDAKSGEKRRDQF
jgi:hypothetical protein